MRIYYHPRFRGAVKRLPRASQLKAENREKVFRQNPFDPRLDTHKLHGKLKDLWSFAIDRKHRILFAFDNGDIIFLDAGDHDIYK